MMRNKFSLGERVVIPFLRQQGVRQLDHVILSHLDQDHSGAFPAIQKPLQLHRFSPMNAVTKCRLRIIFHFVSKVRTGHIPM